MFDEIDLLTTAFSLCVMRKVADADGVLDYSEIELLGMLFSDELLQQMGFVDAQGHFTPAYDAMVDRARAELPGRLDADRKLALVAQYWELCGVDDGAHATEIAVVKEAGAMLGLPADRVDAWLKELGA